MDRARSLTVAEQILNLHEIRCSNLVPCHHSHINHVVAADSRYIVRCSSDSESVSRLAAEAELLRQIKGVVPMPDILFCGEIGGAGYQVRSYVPGHTLATCWPALNSPQKERVCKDFAAALRALHTVHFKGYGYVCLPGGSYESFQAFMVEGFRRLSDRIERSEALAMLGGLAAQVKEYFMRESACFSHSEPCRLVHNDLWFGNVLIHEGRVAALLDFELSQKGPPDAELFKIGCFCKHPDLFGVTGGDYSDFPAMFRGAYPELFEFPRPETRQNLYELASLWTGLVFDTEADGATREAVDHVVGVSTAILDGTIARVF